MKKSQRSKQAFMKSILALMLCISMLAGTTFAWFVDVAYTGVQNIVSGELKVDIVDAEEKTLTNGPLAFKKAEGHENEDLLWEPGVTYELQDFYIKNKGNLALKYKIYINGAVGDATLLNALEFSVKVGNATTDISTFEGHLVENEMSELVKISVHMSEEAGNEYQNLKLEGIGITVSAAQDSVEYDSYGNDYDQDAEYSVINHPVNVVVDIPASKIGADNKLTEAITISAANGVYAEIPVGTKLEEGATQLQFTINYLEAPTGNMSVEENEELTAVDVHIAGIAEDNEQPIKICLGNMLSKGLNSGNYSLGHVEDGNTNVMTENEELSEHNQYDYDPATGFVTISIATFSEIMAVNDTVAKWEGGYDYSWYNNAVTLAEETGETTYIIANADQLAAFGAIVGGMNGQSKDSFKDKTVKLISDIDLGDDEENNVENKIFYPIGYHNSTGSYEKTSGGSVTSNVSSFEGTFDGNGHTISNFYQNTWEMFGDYNDGYSGTPNHYKDAMGLFGYVVNGTIKNLTVDNFRSDGEFAPTGVIAAYAVNSTFENIAITNCNPRVYNTGNGGIVGISGNTNDPDTYKLTFTNITIDNSNIISALWGSWDVACGGLVGMFRGAGHVYMTNCHVAAQMDVYNDVCGNYQYYWYRYSGMMVGTNKNMITDKEGYTVPETSKFHAKDCTVHFGAWNNYWYCELVANSLASYTHDHQFSRLTQVDSIDVENMTVTVGGETIAIPTSGRANYVVATKKNDVYSTENATCYHFVNGSVWNHEEAGTEVVNDITVFKEDNQHIYLPFNQLFTGYGWGVKHIPVYNGEDYAFDGITILDRPVANSKVKFEVVTNKTSYMTNTTLKIGDLFQAVDIGEDLNIKPENVQVMISPHEGSSVDAEYKPNTEDWTQGTLTFSGLGNASITITDYYYCIPTTVSVEIVEPAFEFAFDHGNQENYADKYLYRVGNENSIAVGSLFKTTTGEKVSAASVEITGMMDTGVKGTYTPNETDWAQGKIKFEGTGPVAVAVGDDENATTFYLEVVNATNHVSDTISSLKGNTVLLCNTKLNDKGSLALQNATLYGNGFTIDVSKGRINGESVTANYLLYLNNGVLDNVQIVGAVYTEYGVLSSDNYNNPTVLAIGDSVIANSYISNCASPVRVRSGNISIENTTLKGGNFANLDIRGGNVLLKNVTTINQLDMNDKAADGTEVVGLGVVVFYEGPSSDTMLKIEGDLKQYNSLSQNTKLSNSYASAFVKKMFDNEYISYSYTDTDNAKWVNTGVISMIEVVDKDNIDISGQTNKNQYAGTAVEYNASNKGYLYTTLGKEPVILEDTFVPFAQKEIIPKVSIDHDVNKYLKQEGSDKSCTYDSLTNTETITINKGDSFDWNVNVLKGENVTYKVYMNDVEYADSISFNEEGEHKIVFKYVDATNYRLAENGVEQYSVDYEKSMNIKVITIEQQAKNAEITFPLLESYGTTKVTVDGKTYIMPNLTGTNVPKYGDDLTFDASTRKYGSLKSDGRSSVDIYYPIIKTAISGNHMVFPVFGNENGTLVEIQDYSDRGLGDALNSPYNAFTQEMPSNLSVSRGYTVQWKTEKDVVGSGSMSYGGWTEGLQAFKYQSSSDSIRCGLKSNYLSYYPDINLKSNDRNEQVMVAEYKYVDNKGDTVYYCVGYHIEERNSGYAFGETVPEKQTTCIAEGTRITLKNGLKKAVEDLRKGDLVMSYDHVTGKLTAQEVIIVVKTESDFYENTFVFDDGTKLVTINEHGIYDLTLKKYVNISKDNAHEYIGHDFVSVDWLKQIESKKLVNVISEYKSGYKYDIVTDQTLNYIAENTLSVTHVLVDVINSFDFNSDMIYDPTKMQEDIEKYGLYTYDEWKDYADIEVFEQYNIPIMKVGIEKGLFTKEYIIHLINTYVLDESVQIID